VRSHLSCHQRRKGFNLGGLCKENSAVSLLVFRLSSDFIFIECLRPIDGDDGSGVGDKFRLCLRRKTPSTKPPSGLPSVTLNEYRRLASIDILGVNGDVGANIMRSSANMCVGDAGQHATGDKQTGGLLQSSDDTTGKQLADINIEATNSS